MAEIGLRRKLVLHKETLRVLTEDQLRRAAGGTTADAEACFGSDTCPTCGCSGQSVAYGSGGGTSCVEYCVCAVPGVPL